ncbi:MAG: hypothetical protein IJ642_08585 [Oscillospiraceae bacterium]|nr:hypothetical protein [Oscillospiraceae bacterium]
MNPNLSPYDSARFFAIWDAFYFTLTIEQLKVEIQPNALSMKLNVNASKLYHKYYIWYTNKRTHKGRMIQLRYDVNHPIMIQPTTPVSEITDSSLSSDEITPMEESDSDSDA